MALESSGGFRSSSSPVKLRSTSLVVLSAGAALVALIGYLYMKSRQSKEKETTTEKTKRKVSAVSKEEIENSHKEVEEEETELVMSIVDTETVVVDKETKSSCCHKKEEANCSEIVEEVDFERISRDLVRIVLNCAVKKMVHENDELTHLMSNETTRTECSSSTSPSSSASSSSSSSSSKRCRNGTSGGTDEAELDEVTTHELSMLETDSSSSSSSGEHTTSLIESPNTSYHQETTSVETSNSQQTQPTSSSSTNLMKSSSTTSTASTASSAAVEAPIQQQPTVSLRQQTMATTTVQSPSKQQYQPQNKKLLKTTNKPKPLNIHNKNTNDKPKSVAAQPTTTKSESHEEPQQQQQQNKKQHNESQSTDSAHEDIIVYEFNFPRKFCGKLIGKNGIHVDHIRSKTRTQIAVRDDPEKHEQQIVCVSGRLEDVDQALDIISSRFPLKQYPTISFKPISKPIVYRRLSSNVNGGVESKRALPFENSCVKKVLVAPNMFVDMKSAANEPINVHVSAVVNASHVFVQLPGNSTYESLQKLDECMLDVYGRNNNNKNSSSNQDEEQVPVMSEPIEFGSICVAPTSYGWHRAMVTSYMSLQEARAQYVDYVEECGLATVKFLDYGGYLTIPANQLRQLRSDFMLLPFQAVECYLDGIYVYQGAEEEGKKFLTEIIKGAQLKLSLCGYAEDGIPLIKLFLTNNIYQNLNLNSELVNYNYVFQIESESASASEQPLTKQQQQQQHSIEA